MGITDRAIGSVLFTLELEEEGGVQLARYIQGKTNPKNMAPHAYQLRLYTFCIVDSRKQGVQRRTTEDTACHAGPSSLPRFRAWKVSLHPPAPRPIRPRRKKKG